MSIRTSMHTIASKGLTVKQGNLQNGLTLLLVSRGDGQGVTKEARCGAQYNLICIYRIMTSKYLEIVFLVRIYQYVFTIACMYGYAQTP
jgi:hypothetical protein